MGGDMNMGFLPTVFIMLSAGCVKELAR